MCVTSVQQDQGGGSSDGDMSLFALSGEQSNFPSNHSASKTIVYAPHPKSREGTMGSRMACASNRGSRIADARLSVSSVLSGLSSGLALLRLLDGLYCVTGGIV